MENDFQLVEFLKKVQNKLSVDEWEINGLKIWPIIRNEIVYNTTSSKSLNVLNEEIKTKNFKEFDFNRVKKCDIIILGNSRYGQSFNGVRYDKYFCGIIDAVKQYGIDILFLDRVTSDIKDKFHNDFFDIERFMKKIYISNRFTKISSLNINGYDEFVFMLQEFSKMNNIDVNIITKERIIKIYNQIKNLSLFFEIIIKVTGAKVFMYPCYYGIIGYSINLACDNIGINSVEMQHASIEKQVMYHGFNISKNVEYNIFPKYFWGWDKDILPESLYCDEKERSKRFLCGGNIWYYFWGNNLKEKEKYIKCKKNKMNILITQHDDIDEFILKAIEKSPTEYKWFIRFHPKLINSQRNDIIKKVNKFSENVEFKIANEINILDLLSYMDVHITGYSSSFYEASLIGVPSILTNTLGEEIYKDKDGYYKSAYNTEDLLNCLENLEKSQIKKSNAGEDIEEAFNNGIKKIISLIRETYIEPSKIKYIDYIQNVFEHKPEKTNEELKEKIARLYNLKDANKLYFIGKYNYFIEEYEKAAKYLKEYIIAEQMNLTNIGYVLDSILLYNQIDKKYINECFKTYELLEKIIGNNKYLIEPILHSLFNNNKYDYILKLSKFCNDNKLTYIYLAKSYKQLKDYKNAIYYFIGLIKFLEQENINYKYILSVYFHLAESYYISKDYINAKKYFLKCDELTGGYHIKAKEYLEILNCK